MALDGNIKLGLDLDTKPAKNALSSFKSKLRDGFGSNDTKTLDNSIKTTEQNIKKLENQAEKAREKLQELNDSDIKPKSVKELEKELATTEKQIAKLDAQYEKLDAEQADLVSRKVDGLTIEQSLNSEQQARFQQVQDELIKNGQQTDKLNAKAEHLRNLINEMSANKNLTEEGRKYNRQLTRATEQIQEQKKQLDELRAKQGKTGHEAKIQLKGIKSILRRIKGLVKRVLFFSIITKGLNSLKRKVIELVKTNTELSNSVSTIKGNFITAFAPLWQTILPHLQNFLNVMVKVSAIIAQLMSQLFGMTVEQSKEIADGLNEQVHGIKQAEKEAKSLTGFDTMNVFQDNKKSEGSGAGSNTNLKTDFKIDPAIKEKLKGLLVLIGSIGGALGLWKLTQLLKDLPTAISKFKTLGGIVMLIAGAYELITGYCDAWVNGIDWKNFTKILVGLAGVVGGITLLVGPLAGAFALVGGAIALVVLAVKDMIDNGPTLQNVLMLIIGVVGVGVGVWWALSVAELGALGPIALIVAGIVALIAVFVLLWNKCDKFREFWINLWERIKEGWHNFVDDFKESIEGIKDFFANFKDRMVEFKDAFIDGIKDTIDKAKNKISELKEHFKSVGEILKNNFKNTFNNIAGMLERFINNCIKGINSLGAGLRNSINEGAEKIGLDIKINPISPVNLPRLAKGAVIPANKEFLAVLGDQKQGRNLEAPEELIRQIVREESGGHNFNIKATGSLAPLIRLLSLELEEENNRRTAF